MRFLYDELIFEDKVNLYEDKQNGLSYKSIAKNME